MNKLIFLIALTLIGCASKRIEKTPTAADQVAGLQKMCIESAPAIKAREENKSLYLRLGEKKGIEAFITNLYLTHKKNKQISHMLDNVDKEKFIKHSTQFLVIGTGGKGKYEGRNMKDTHSRLNISNADFMSAGADVQNTMKSMNYGENEIQEVVCKLVHFIPQVVVR